MNNPEYGPEEVLREIEAEADILSIFKALDPSEPDFESRLNRSFNKIKDLFEQVRTEKAQEETNFNDGIL